MADEGLQVLTIGHSTRPLGEFLDLLEHHGWGTVVDVRSLPRSRRYPQFNREALAAALEARGISYRHCAPLGGLRQPLDPSESVNRGLRNERFRAYADHMQTAEFADAVARLVDLARAYRCAVMCAEAVPWRCHRSLLADALVARGWPASSTSSTGTGPMSIGSAKRPWSRTGWSRTRRIRGSSGAPCDRGRSGARARSGKRVSEGGGPPTPPVPGSGRRDGARISVSFPDRHCNGDGAATTETAGGVRSPPRRA